MGGGNRCTIPECQSVRKRMKFDDKKTISLFKPPKNADLFEKWQKAIPNQDFTLTYKDRVCEFHFKTEDLEHYYITKLSDGSISKIKRGRVMLNPKAVPTFFPIPTDTEDTVKRKIPKETIEDPIEPVEIDTVLDIEAVELNQVIDIEPIEAFELVPAVEPALGIELPEEQTESNFEQFLFKDLLYQLTSILVPKDLWGVTAASNFILFSRWNDDYTLQKKVVIEHDLNVKIFIQEQDINATESKRISSIEDVTDLIKIVENMKTCAGATDKSMKKCSIILITKKSGPEKIWCTNCINMKKNNKRKALKNTVLGYKKLQSRLNNAKKMTKRLKQKVGLLKEKILKCKMASAKIKKEALEEAIEALPASQKEAILACFEAAKLKNKKQSRYTLQWIYECLLIRVKSKTSYEHLRRNKILALPTIQTLNRYIEKVKGIYGFQSTIFSIMKKKSENMEIADRRGVILLDEMKISPRLKFNRKTLKVEGFTDLGSATPDNLKTKKGDHVLVFMYQPFRGRWVQALACFLTKSAASGTILHRLVLECLILLENAGFYVDGITCDGAAWNRNMWDKFGICDENVSCTHVCDSERRLWFFSDFPHLIKNVRNAVISKLSLKTPDGEISKRFWEAVIVSDNLGYGLQMCHKLKWDHVHPKFYQKMNVAMAFQFFSDDVAEAMVQYRKKTENLNGSEGCVTFIRRMDKLIKAMSSRCPKDALRADSSSMEAIETFLLYLNEWEDFKDNHGGDFLSKSTGLGLKITLKGTLELFDYLKTKHNYNYLMTSRLSQDVLERFFSMMRSACGCNDHPDGSTFLQLFRLLSTYSLVKPPKGSNVQGSDMVSTLLNSNDLSDAENQHEEFNNRLELLLKTGSETPVVINAEDHSYFQQNSPETVVAYLAGFVAYRGMKIVKCNVCKDLLVLDKDKENTAPSVYDLIKAKSLGNLKYPSEELLSLISTLENSIMRVVSTQKIQIDTLSDIISDLEQVSDLPLVGCRQHQKTLTKALMNYYLMLRMNFLCKRENTIDDEKANKSRQHKKLSRL